MIRSAEPIIEYDVELYFALVEKKTVFADGRLIVGLLDGTMVEYEIDLKNWSWWFVITLTSFLGF